MQGTRPQVATIGVYGFSGESFLSALRSAGVCRVLDVRQRRGVRGAQYSWANARRLEAILARAGIAYEHHRELAPTTELRELQYAVDAAEGVAKRTRRTLATEYRRRYVREILDRVDLRPLAASLRGRPPAALLCVEGEPEACHRSLIAARLSGKYGAMVTNLRPTEPTPRRELAYFSDVQL